MPRIAPLAVNGHVSSFEMPVAFGHPANSDMLMRIVGHLADPLTLVMQGTVAI